MKIQYFHTVASSGYAEQILALLTMADKEFIPPLSSRGSTTQSDLSGSASCSDGVAAYYQEMAQQPAALAVVDGRCLGFMAFKENYTCDQISALPNFYASTCVVHPDARGQGLMRKFYEKIIELYPAHTICTRTWHTNFSHLHVLEQLGFAEIARLKDHRGPGLDTVYFCRKYMDKQEEMA